MQIKTQTKKFIIVNDEKLAAEMVTAGFLLISQDGNMYRFINSIPPECKMNFDVNKMIFTDMLSI